MFWNRFILWFVPSKTRQCKGCCLYCTYFEDCYNDIMILKQFDEV